MTKQQQLHILYKYMDIVIYFVYLEPYHQTFVSMCFRNKDLQQSTVLVLHISLYPEGCISIGQIPTCTVAVLNFYKH